LLNRDIISNSIPSLTGKDSVGHALSLMEEFHLSHLAVTEQDKYSGLVFEDDLMNQDEGELLDMIAHRFSKIAVQANSHSLEAVQIANDYRLTVVPVIEKEGEYVGVITASDLLHVLGRLTGASEPGAVIVLEMEQRSFSFSEISKMVETNDAQITQLNTWWNTQSESLIVTIKINKYEISDILATFQRYEYQVKYYFGEELYENELRSNYDHLMNYLNI
jgi:acetoin utilization protein AcuB